MPLDIEYISEDFPASSTIRNGYDVLRTNWDELLWAAVTVGRPNRHYVFRHGLASMYEAIFRWSLVRMALEQSGPSAHRLRRTSAAKTLDPSEKGAVNYFLGMTFCKLFSTRLLNAPWMLHLDVFRPSLNTVLSGRSRPDLIGQTLSNEWIAIESKGRVSSPSSDTKDKAKQQAQSIISIDGIVPRFHIGAITYFRNDVLQFFWRDPEISPEGVKNPIKLTIDPGVWQFYYQPIYDLIYSHPDTFKQMFDEPVLLPIKEFDIEIGIHPKILSLLSESNWEKAKYVCNQHVRDLQSDGYQPDGIRIVAGSTWYSPFKDENAL
jgi:hypothetical protein